MGAQMRAKPAKTSAELHLCCAFPGFPWWICKGVAQIYRPAYTDAEMFATQTIYLLTFQRDKS